MALIEHIAVREDEDAAKNKILSIIGMGLGFDEIPTSNVDGESRTKLNQIAVAKGLPRLLPLEPGKSFREKCNALIDAVNPDTTAIWYYDVLSGIVIAEGVPYDPSDILTCARSTLGYAEALNDSWIEFGVEALRVTNRGLLVEPAATDISWNPVVGSNWVGLQVTLEPDVGGPYLSVFNSPQVATLSAASLNGRARASVNMSTVVQDTTYALTYWVKAGTTSLVGLFATGNAGTSRITLDLANEYAISSSGSNRGPMTFVSGREVGNAGVHEIKVLWVPNFTGGGDPMGVGPGSAQIGDTCIVVGFRMEAGTEFTSPSGPSGGSANVLRDADDVSFELPDGTHDVVFTFDDDSTQTISGQTGTFTIPTDLDGQYITLIEVI